MAEGANRLSRNPNVCASCSSMLDGMESEVLPNDSPAPRSAVAKASAANPANQPDVVAA